MANKIECAIQDCTRRTIGDAPWCVPHLRQMSITGNPLAAHKPTAAASSTSGEPAAESVPGEPVGRPKSHTSRRELWEAYAIELGADPAEIEKLLKRELIELCDRLEAAAAVDVDEVEVPAP